MAVTVEDVLKIDFMAERATLVAGRSGLDNVISYVTIMEAPDFYEWVTGGEFVLTTWYAFVEHPELQVPAFTELAKRGIAAMGIKVNRFVKEIPQDIIDIANQFRLPVFAIRRETKFREIIQAISAELNDYHMNVLLDVDKHYQELSKAAVTGGEIDTMLQGLSRRRNCPCLCLNRQYELIAWHAPDNRQLPVGPISEEVRRLYSGEKQGWQHCRSDGLHIFPCVAQENPLGFLVLVDKRILSERYILMAHQLATFLTMKLLDRLETEQKLISSLLEDILFKNSLDEQELRDRLDLFGLKPQGHFRIIVIKLQAGEPDIDNAQILRHYGYAVRDILGDALLVIKPDEVVLIAASQLPDTVGAKPKWLKRLAEFVAGTKEAISVGIGPSVAEATTIKTSYGIAKRTLKASVSLGGSGLLYYGEYLAHTALLRAVDTPEQELLLDSVIRPIQEYDDKYHANLLQTMAAVIFSPDLEKSAAMMHIHINTVRYRLGKIRSITGLDFFAPRDRYILATAYLLHTFS